MVRESIWKEEKGVMSVERILHVARERLVTIRDNAPLVEARGSPRMRRLYIDTGVLDVLGPHIDWLALTAPSF
jgi:hypothetical protein